MFQGCIDGYKLFHTAQAIGKDGDFLRVKLQKERLRLEEWASRAGLQDGQHSERLNWNFICHILEQQRLLLTSSEYVRKKYRVRLIEEEFGGDDVEEKKPSSGLERLLPTLRPKLYEETNNARAIRAANGTFKRLKWAVAGREKLSKIIDDLAALNDELERLLDAADQSWLRSSMAALLREMLSRSSSENEVMDLQQLLRPAVSTEEHALHAAAAFKRIRLVLDVDKRGDEISPAENTAAPETLPSLKMLRPKHLSNTRSDVVGLHFARYKDAPVLVEWRVTTAHMYEDLKPHVENLALLLGSTDASFANLHCTGIVCSEKKSCFALVYAVPPAADLNPAAEFECQSLRRLIDVQTRVSLEDRLSIALQLAQAVLQLHTAGWLHKSIRSEHVIFVGDGEGCAESLLSGKPYLTGYEFARPVAVPSVSERVVSPLSTDLYLHPEKRGRSSPGFRKAFDLYALATLLIEVAMWEPLEIVLSRQTGKPWAKLISDAESNGNDLELPSLVEHVETLAFRREVTHSVGPTFCDAIRLCFDAESSDLKELDSSIQVQQTVVDRLRSCNF